MDDRTGVEHKPLHRGVEDEQKVIGDAQLGSQGPVFSVETCA